MKALNQSATRTLLALVAGLPEGEGRTLNNSRVFSPAHVTVSRVTNGRKLVAVSHRTEVGMGDTSPDPDVEFLLVEVLGEVKAYPLAIDQIMGYRRVAEVDANLNPKTFRPAGQRDVALFCNTWMRNIAHQQGVKGLSTLGGLS